MAVGLGDPHGSVDVGVGVGDGKYGSPRVALLTPVLGPTDDGLVVGVVLVHTGVAGVVRIFVGGGFVRGVDLVVCTMPGGVFDLLCFVDGETDDVVVGGEVRVLTVWLLDGAPLWTRPTIAPAMAITTTVLLAE